MHLVFAVTLEGYISGGSSALPLLAGIITYRKLTTPMRMLSVLYLLAVFTDISAMYLSTKGIHTIWLFLLYAILEMGFIFWILSYWHQSSRLRQITLFVFIAFTLFILISQIVLSPGALYMEIQAARSVLLAVVLIFTLFRLENVVISLVWDYRFWVTAGYLIYYAGVTVMYTSGLFMDQDLYLQIYDVLHLTLNITNNLIMVSAFLLCYNRSFDTP